MKSTHRRPRVSAWSDDRVLWTWRREIERRGWETEIGGDSDWGWQVSPLAIADRDGAQVLLRAEGMELYGTHVPLRRERAVSYVGGLVGWTPWARQVPGTIKNVAEARDWLVPAEVARREHIRHGSLYLVCMERRSATSPSGRYAGHTWDAEKRAFVDHLGQPVMTAPASWPGVKLVAQKAP